jgi:hypothetical protein
MSSSQNSSLQYESEHTNKLKHLNADGSFYLVNTCGVVCSRLSKIFDISKIVPDKSFKIHADSHF